MWQAEKICHAVITYHDMFLCSVQNSGNSEAGFSHLPFRNFPCKMLTTVHYMQWDYSPINIVKTFSKHSPLPVPYTVVLQFAPSQALMPWLSLFFFWAITKLAESGVGTSTDCSKMCFAWWVVKLLRTLYPLIEVVRTLYLLLHYPSTLSLYFSSPTLGVT